MQQTKKQEKNYTNINNNNNKSININSISLSITSIVNILRIQKLTIIKSKKYLLEALNCV